MEPGDILTDFLVYLVTKGWLSLSDGDFEEIIDAYWKSFQ